MRPRILRYDDGSTTGPFKWGFKVLQNLRPHDRVYEWFKLGLCPQYEDRCASESRLDKKYPSPTGIAPAQGDKAETLVVDYLTSLKNRVDEHFSGLGKLVNDIPREYIITVPAIWDHKEQDRTRNCAERAGMGKGSALQIISEPEAAAIYALGNMSEIDLEPQDAFIICDAGGG